MFSLPLAGVVEFTEDGKIGIPTLGLRPGSDDRCRPRRLF
jgi:hypothetical protein